LQKLPAWKTELMLLCKCSQVYAEVLMNNTR